MPDTGFVYFILASDVSRIKVGFTSCDPEARLSNCLTGSPVPLSLYGHVTTQLPMLCEKTIHNILTHEGHHSHREWFVWTPAVHQLTDRFLNCGKHPSGRRKYPVPGHFYDAYKGWKKGLGEKPAHWQKVIH